MRIDYIILEASPGSNVIVVQLTQSKRCVMFVNCHRARKITEDGVIFLDNRISKFAKVVWKDYLTGKKKPFRE